MRLLVLFLELKTAFLLCKRLRNVCLRYIFRYFNQKGLKQLHFYGNIVIELSHVIQERDEGAGTHISSTPEGAEALSPGQWIQSARPEGAEALSPGHRPGYNDNQKGAL